MSAPISKMFREMMARGVDPDMIALAIETAEQTSNSAVSVGIPVESSAEKRRAYDRDRKRISAEIRRNSGGNPRNSGNASLYKEDKKEEFKEEVGARKAVSRGERLPDDWHPSPQDRATADELIGASRVGAEFEKFRDHWKQQPGTKGVKLDWNAAWRNWIRRAAEYGGKNGHSTFNGTRRSASSDFFAGIASVAADLAGNGPTPGLASEEIPLGRHNIDG